MARPEVRPILAEDLDSFTRFLQEQFGSTHTPEEWRSAFQQPWCPDRPNHGFMLVDGNRVVGVLGAIYADRELRGETRRFCNISGWNVLEEYRMHSMRLATALTAQEGLHFTDFTPTNTVMKSLKFLKFKEYDARQVIVPNLPFLGALGTRVRVLDAPAAMAEHLDPTQSQVMQDHLHLTWLRQVVLLHPEGAVHVVYKPIEYGGRPCAFVMAVSERRLFTQSFSAFRAYLRRCQGLRCTRLERRFLMRTPMGARPVASSPRKLYSSSALGEAEMDNLYTELVALDIRPSLL